MHEFMEKVYSHAGSGTKNPINVIRLTDFGWDTSETECFNRCKTALANQVTLLIGIHLNNLMFTRMRQTFIALGW